jgi:hypothetical protein
MIPIAARRAGRNALDEFFPERVLTSESQPQAGAAPLDFLASTEVRLDPVERLREPAVKTMPAAVQVWPMLAAAMVALGVSLLVLATFARYASLAP